MGYHIEQLSNFKCKQSDCRRSCCRADWEIRLSNEEYEACRVQSAVENLPLSVENSFEPRLRGGYRCCVNENGFCSLLSEKGLCKWRLETSKYPGITCDTFPVLSISYCESVCVFHSLACEAVVEILVKEKAPLLLTNRAVEGGEYPAAVHIKNEDFQRRPLLGYYPELLRTGIGILQNRDKSLDSRMIMLAEMMFHLDFCEKHGALGINDVISRYTHPKTTPEYNLNEDLHVPTAWLAVSSGVMMEWLRYSPFLDFALKCLDALGFKAELQTRGERRGYKVELADAKRYIHLRFRLQSLMEKYSEFIENILVCEYLRSMTPLTKPDVWGSFCCFAVWYASIKAVLCGLAESENDEKRLIDTIVLMQRAFSHGDDNAAMALELLASKGLDNYDGVLAILRT